MPRVQAPAGPGAHLAGQTWLSSGHARPVLAPDHSTLGSRTPPRGDLVVRSGASTTPGI